MISHLLNSTISTVVSSVLVSQLSVSAVGRKQKLFVCLVEADFRIFCKLFVNIGRSVYLVTGWKPVILLSKRRIARTYEI